MLAGDELEVYGTGDGALLRRVRLDGLSWAKDPSHELFGVDAAWFSGDGRFVILAAAMGPSREPVPGEVVSSEGLSVVVADLTTENSMQAAVDFPRLAGQA